MKKSEELILIPKYNSYVEYILEMLIKLPRTEKFSIGNEYKAIMYEDMRNILYVNKLPHENRLFYLNKLDADFNVQRSFLRIMYKNKWIDKKKFDVSITMLGEIERIVGGLIKYYAKNNKKPI